MIFLFPRWDMLIPWRVLLRVHVKLGESILHETPEDMADAETPDAPADGPTLPTEAVEATVILRLIRFFLGGELERW